MTEHTTNSAPVNSVQPTDDDQRSLRRQRLEARREARDDGGIGAWVTGLVFICLGVLFLLQNMGMLTLMQNWWALFILIPAVGAFANAWRAFRKADGRLTRAARGSIVGGLVLTLVAAAFLFSLDWAILGPILIILAGIGVLVNVTLPGERE